MLPTLIGQLAAALFWTAFVAVLVTEYRQQIRYDRENQP